jgi:hypothetical protein
MKSKLFDLASQLGSKAGEALSSATAKASTFVQEHKPDEQQIDQAKAWVKRAATDTAVGATRMGKEVMRSDLAKDAAKGAVVGAANAVPLPIVGPAISAVVGAGIGVYANLTRTAPTIPKSADALAPQHSQTDQVAPTSPVKDVYAELLKLDDLLKKGILTQAEFDSQKAKVLDGAR